MTSTDTMMTQICDAISPGHIDFKPRFTYKACIWKSFHRAGLWGAMTSKLRMFCFKAPNDIYYPKVPWAITWRRNILINPVPFFIMWVEIAQNVVTQTLSFPVVLQIHKCSSQPLHCPSQWAANCHKDSSKLWVTTVKWHSFSFHQIPHKIATIKSPHRE